MNKRTKRWLIITGILLVFFLGVFATLLLQKKEVVEVTPLIMSPEEKARFNALEQVKLITEEEIQGAFTDTAFKITGFEETGMESVQRIQDDYYQKMIEAEDSFLRKKTKAWLNELNARELYAHFVVDYGLGFDLEPLLSRIQVDEYTGKVSIPTPELVLTQFYVDPTFLIEEKNGALVTLLNREFTRAETDFLIKEMEEGIKTRILHNETTRPIAIEATKQRIAELLQRVNPRVTVVFN